MKRITGVLIAFSLIFILFSCAFTSGETNSTDTSEPSSRDDPERSEEEYSYDYSDPNVSVYGRYGKKYFELMESGVYCRKTVESRSVGGEAFPYTVTVYRKGEIMNVVIEESYGVKTSYIIRDGKQIILDPFNKTAYVYEYDGTVYEKPLWNGIIRLKSEGTQVLFSTPYDYETYTDSTGFEFTVFYTEGVPERYRSYDEERLDTIVIDFTVTDDLSGAVFDIPGSYTVTDHTK